MAGKHIELKMAFWEKLFFLSTSVDFSVGVSCYN